MHEHPLPIGTPIRFSIADGLDIGEAIITDAEYDDGWLYRIDVTNGSRADMHRNA